MAGRNLVVLKVLVSEEAARALRSVQETERPRALVRFLSAQEEPDLRGAVHALRVVPWTGKTKDD